MVGNWLDGPWVVGVLDTPEQFWRLLKTNGASEESLRPDSEVRKRYGTEDHCTYRGFSAFLEEGKAREYATQVFNPEALKAGREPFTHLVSFQVGPKTRDVCGSVTPPDGHFSIWGDAKTLALSLGSVFPI